MYSKDAGPALGGRFAERVVQNQNYKISMDLISLS